MKTCGEMMIVFVWSMRTIISHGICGKNKWKACFIHSFINHRTALLFSDLENRLDFWFEYGLDKVDMQKWKILLYSQTFLRYDSINYLTKKWNVFHRIVFEFTPIRCRTSISKEILFWGEVHRTTTGKEKKGCDRIKLKTCKTFLMEIYKTSQKNSLGVNVEIKKLLSIRYIFVEAKIINWTYRKTW